jgi:hypothetical protein
MSERERIQLNLRLDGHKDLYEAVKDAAARQNASVNAFVINALKAAVGWETTNHTTDTSIPNVEAIVEAVKKELDSTLDTALDTRRDATLDTRLDAKLAEFEQRLLVKLEAW